MTSARPDLRRFGWDDDLAAAFDALGAARGEAGRIVLEHQHLYRVATADDDVAAAVSGRFRHRATLRSDFPAVGDWVSIERKAEGRALIHTLLPRRSRFVRKVAGHETAAQVIAANIDLALVVAGLDADFNLRRIERYLVTAWEGGSSPVVVLNKADVCADIEARIVELAAVAPDVPVHVVSCRTGLGMPALVSCITPGRTAALLGSSGVGKSSIINYFLGFDRQRTRDVRVQDSRGRHTTTNRELVALPSGGLLIDTPGIRELQLWNVGDALDDVFEDVRRKAADCHYRDCLHDTEPRCAVKAAVDAGTIPRERLENYRRLQSELRHLATKQDERLTLDEKRRDRTLHRAQKSFRKKGT
ncbi:MAG: ribosome small subunit-dependent GTPase A [Vicinamibacterales bacterium]